MNDCIFCQIVAGLSPAKKVYEDEHTLAFWTIEPKARTHVLVIPKMHLSSLEDPDESALEKWMPHMFTTVRKLARLGGFEDYGYRLLCHTLKGGGQEVFHLHVHLMSDSPTASLPLIN